MTAPPDNKEQTAKSSIKVATISFVATCSIILLYPRLHLEPTRSDAPATSAIGYGRP
jgi:hypothetical protein